MSTNAWTRLSGAHRRTYLLAGTVAVVGLAGAGLWAGTALLHEIDRPAGFARITTPGDGTVALDAGDVRVVYAEGPAAPPAAAQVEVTGPDGTSVPVSPYGGALEYDVPRSIDGGRDAVGTAVGRFTAVDARAYEVGSPPVTGTLALGRDLAPGTVRAIVLPALLGLTSLVAGLVLAVRTAVRHTRGA